MNCSGSWSAMVLVDEPKEHVRGAAQDRSELWDGTGRSGRRQAGQTFGTLLMGIQNGLAAV